MPPAWIARASAPHKGKSLFILTYIERKSIYSPPSQNEVPMNACPNFPATLVDRVGGLIYRIVAFLVLGIGASILGTTNAMTSQTRARIVTPAARLLALTRNFARMVERARRGTKLVRHAGPDARRIRGGVGELQAGHTDRRVAAGGARGVAAGVKGWRDAAGRGSSDDGQTYGRAFNDGGRAGFQLAASAGATRASGETRSNTRDCGQSSASVLRRRLANSVLAPGLVALSTSSDEGASRASCEFSTGFRNWVRALGAG